MKRKSLLLALILLVSFALVACGGGGNKPAENANANTNAADEAKDGELKLDQKVGFVTDEGGISDQSFNQGVWEGLEKAKTDFGVSISFQESNIAADYAPNIETLIDDGNQLVVAAGFKLGDAMLEAAKANPDVKFAIIDMAYEDTPSNLLGIMFKAEQPSFLVGYIAALTTETNKVGFVGGIESNIIDGFDYGFHAGVNYGAKELGKEITIERQYVASFTDAAKGKSIATNMYQQGADVVFHAAGGAGDGVIEAAQEQDKWAIGVDRDQNYLAPKNVLTSAMKRADVAIYNLIKLEAEGKEFPGGTTMTFGLQDDGAVDIAPTSADNVKKEILDKIPELKEKIIKEEIKVPYNKDTYDEFLGTL